MNHDELIALLHKYHLRPDKRLGQHYLIDTTILASIIEAAAIEKDELVVEIGGGPGILTRALAQAGAEVLTVEYDRDFAYLLQEEYHNWRNVHVLCDDALRLDFGGLVKEDQPYKKMVANIPYQITNPLVRKILAPGSVIETAILLIQKEVAQRLTSQPGSSNRGILTIMIEYYGKAEIVLPVPAESFWPAPKVESAVIKITRNTMNAQSPLPADQEKGFFWFVKQGFSGKRKTLSNSLSGGLALPKQEMVQLIDDAQLDQKFRAEDLSLPQWITLFKAFLARYPISEPNKEA
jgi:16S rRNA (adenine1518-N6/adenine1519-N6)-dimethyltransferase